MIIKYLDRNNYTKKERALKRYFIKCYKYLIFKVIPTLKRSGKKDGIYEIELPIEDLFKKVYGSMKLKFSVYKDIAVIEDIVPDEILMSCFMRDLPIYKGIPYRNEKDLKKIKIMEKLK